MHQVTLSSKYQIVIPRALRESMDLKAGQKFLMVPKGRGIHLVPQYALDDIRGMMSGSNVDDIRDRNDRV